MGPNANSLIQDYMFLILTIAKAFSFYPVSLLVVILSIYA